MSPTDTIVSRLFARPLPPLEPGKRLFAPELAKEIAKLPEHKYVIAYNLVALHLANDDIHECHMIAQSNEGDPTADLLHATLHRREGDYWNSKYWYSHLSSHPLVPNKAQAKAFVDACERAQGNDEKLREKQWAELKRLVEWTREEYQ